MTSVQGGRLVRNCKSGLFPQRLGGFQVNPDAVLERRNDPAISSNADPLDIGRLAHVRRGLVDVAPLARHSTEGDLAGLGSHICRERSCLLRDRERTQVSSTRRADGVMDRNLILIDAVTEILGLRTHDWADVKRHLSNEQVREIFHVVAYLWPPTTNLSAFLPEPYGKLPGFFVGLERPESILANVLRYSLYTDEIVVISPFTNPHCIVEKHNPVAHPERSRRYAMRLDGG